jgi:hypothetical protein
MKKTSASLKTPARVGNQTLKKSVSIKPPKKLKRASVAKKASKALSSAKPKKPHKRPSGAKAKAIQKGVLSDLRPPRPHEVKRKPPNPFIDLLTAAIRDLEAIPETRIFDRFYDRPDHYIAYGAFYLTLAIYWLKLHHRPEPIDAIKVLEEEIENITQKKSALLLEWGISPEDARQVVESSHRAWLLDFSKRFWGCPDPDKDFLNEKMRERAMILSAKHDWARMQEVFKFISKGEEFDLPAFVSRLNGAVIEKTTGLEGWKVGPADWSRKLIWIWAVSPDQNYADPAGRLSGKIPPVCFWSGPAIVRYFNLPVGDATARRQLDRIGLAETAKSLHYGLEETKHRGKKILRFVK